MDVYGPDNGKIVYSAAKESYFRRGYGPGGCFIGNGTTNVSVSCNTSANAWSTSNPFTLIYYGRLDESKTALTQILARGTWGILSAGDGTNAKVCFAARYAGEGSLTAKLTDPNSYVVGADVCYVLIYEFGKQELWRDGELVATGTDSTGIVSNTGSAAINAWPSFYHAGIFKRSIGSARAREYSRYPNRVYAPLRRNIWVPGSSVGSSNLLPTLISNTQTFYNHNLTTGVVGLTPSLVTNNQTFYPATVSQGGVTLQHSLVNNTQTFFGSTISVGSVTLSPGLLTNGQTFYAPTVTQGVVLRPPLHTNTQTFHAPTISTGAVSLTPSLVTNTQTFFAPTVVNVGGSQSLTPDLFTNEQTFYAPTVSTLTLTQADLDAIAAAVWADTTAVAAHAKLDAIIARLTC